MEIIATKIFQKCVKSLAKRYSSFKKDYDALLDDLEKNPHLGIDLGGGFRKVRMAIASKGKGKSGGARIITFDLVECNGYLFLIYAYDKSDADNVNMDIIKKLVAEMDLDNSYPFIN